MICFAFVSARVASLRLGEKWGVGGGGGGGSGKGGKEDDEKTAAEKFLGTLEEFTKTLKIPTLREYGLDLEKFAEKEEKMAGDSVASGSPANCYKVLSKEEQISVYEILRNK